MNLLQSLDSSHVFICHEITFNECIGFLFAAPVNCVVTISEPVEEGRSLIVGYNLSEFFYIDLADNIRFVLLSIRSCKLQLGSGTNQLILFLPQLSLQILPVVAVLLVVVLFVQDAYKVGDGEPPFLSFVIPYGTDFSILVEPYGDLF